MIHIQSKYSNEIFCVQFWHAEFPGTALIIFLGQSGKHGMKYWNAFSARHKKVHTLTAQEIFKNLFHKNAEIIRKKSEQNSRSYLVFRILELTVILL